MPGFFRKLFSLLFLLALNEAVFARRFGRQGPNFDSTRGIPDNKYVAAFSMLVVAALILGVWRYVWKDANKKIKGRSKKNGPL